MSTYFGILTKVGEAKEANAHVLGVPMRISEMAVGDGGGIVPIPNREQTALIGQKRRAQLNRLYEDPNNPNWIVAEQVIPEGEGGWWVRELGLFDQDGDLVAVANCPPTYKPQLAEGSGRTQIIRMVLLVTSVENIVLKIDPTVVLATREHLDFELAKKVDKSAVIDVPHGGTGRTSVTVGRYLRGNGDLKLEEVTPAQVFHDLGINQAIVDAIAALGTLSRVYSITGLPTTDVGPIIVHEAGEVWNWVDTPFFQGYRSPLCGRPVDGHTVAPLASEVDSVGGVLPKAAYARLWGYAQENGRVVTQALWDANKGGHYFVDVDANTFRVPDLRDMFRRFTGTDADTANARLLGSRQRDAVQRITGQFGMRNTVDVAVTGGAITQTSAGNTAAVGTSGSGPYVVMQFDSSLVARTSSETRSGNVAFHPRIHA
jgi:hypothetical protein